MGRILQTFRFDRFGGVGAQSLSPKADCAPRLRPTLNYCFYYFFSIYFFWGSIKSINGSYRENKIKFIKYIKSKNYFFFIFAS
jgi:hypothetical protein